MSCGRREVGGEALSDHCVADIVRSIVAAQREVAEAEEDTCRTSCRQSIRDLLSPTTEEPVSRPTTVPFLLYCKGNCEPFVGSGVIRRRENRHRVFDCVESPVFRAKGFVGRGNCVQLELLLPVSSKRQSNLEHSPDNLDHHHDSDSICGLFHGRPVRGFRASGVCITVDLDCFCGISCLDAITPLTAGEDC